MSSSEYNDWINNDGFTDSDIRIPLINDVYNKFPDEYDFIFLVLNEPSIPGNLYYYGMLIGQLTYHSNKDSLELMVHLILKK